MKIINKGFYFRSSDSHWVKRWCCKSCGKNFSTATVNSARWQKKRRINPLLVKLLSSNNSMRRSALLLNVDRKTVARRLPFLADQARRSQMKFLKDHQKLIHAVEFDDLETIEHTKCKPISVALAVEHKTRKILGFSVSSMPSKGLLAKNSRKKYGFRIDQRPVGWDLLFSSLQALVVPNAEFRSDSNPQYTQYVKRYFPNSSHIKVEGKRGTVTGQGELKKVGFDPLFSINHTFAMLRANICRLIRKTWCTTKKLEALSDHIAIYVNFHNQIILKSH
ncbi:MAG: hypothetical protein M9962_14475 [Oligoflexia bacterium]|nr:hypothetical protein [Oligoflexia bacterium]